MKVDTERRASIMSNHSATHLMHEALRRELGDHVIQKGSLQDDERTRFDISQPVAVTPEQIATVEDMVNTEIRANTPVETRLMGIEEARETGAMALFGEKYADEVRVLTMGMEDVLVRGTFHGFKRFRFMKLGTVDIEWVYNSMPPGHGQIYPPVALKPVTEF